MSVPRRRIESRLFDAVLLVLASTGCQPAAVGARGPDTTKPTEVASSPDAGAAVVAPPTALDAGTPAGPQPDPAAFCATYKAQSRVDPSTATKVERGTASYPHQVIEFAYWDPSRNSAICTIIRERVQATIEVTHTPTCCPRPGRGKQPACPAPSQVKVQGAKLLVEHVQVSADGSPGARSLRWVAVTDHQEQRHNCGRRPEGMQISGKPEGSGDVGRQLAAMAELEAASVPAFERLARELASHGAPAALVRRARAAMRDEIRHADVMRTLAVQFGGAPRAIEVPALPCRNLAEIARENAIEGCVREAYGALVATYQSECATPDVPALRDAFRAIARDERRHAALSEDVHAWIMETLDLAARETVTAARSAAAHELRASLLDVPACATLGLPGGHQAVALFDAYFA